MGSHFLMAFRNAAALDGLESAAIRESSGMQGQPR